VNEITVKVEFSDNIVSDRLGTYLYEFNFMER